ncbi:MAG: hypothetical protein LBS40_00920 [Burkholderiales bacterium]|jgi:hypothetical protein|nr:hypothetical protein [Burkholderiales bacterium]
MTHFVFPDPPGIRILLPVDNAAATTLASVPDGEYKDEAQNAARAISAEINKPNTNWHNAIAGAANMLGSDNPYTQAVGGAILGSILDASNKPDFAGEMRRLSDNAVKIGATNQSLYGGATPDVERLVGGVFNQADAAYAPDYQKIETAITAIKYRNLNFLNVEIIDNNAVWHNADALTPAARKYRCRQNYRPGPLVPFPRGA